MDNKSFYRAIAIIKEASGNIASIEAELRTRSIDKELEQVIGYQRGLQYALAYNISQVIEAKKSIGDDTTDDYIQLNRIRLNIC